MLIRWKWVVLVLMAVCLFASMSRTAVTAAPQVAAPAKVAAPATGDALIPDTTSAINSPTPMSQRIVHYAIEAKYDPTEHSVDANEVLTYHNVTGQALDHFPFH